MYQVNHGYFGEIDTPEKAYWLGWMASDGYVAHGKYVHVVGLCLQERDREIVDAFRSAIGAEHPVRTIRVKDRTYLELRATSLQMAVDLERFGIVPNKSKTLRCPAISSEFQWDFFRGMFDGDGYVGQRSISLCGTKEIVEAFAELCIKSGYESQVYKHSRGTATWYMRASGRNARGILGVLYGSGVGLSRKRDKEALWIDKMRGRDERLAA
jgi:hypothetical protein